METSNRITVEDIKNIKDSIDKSYLQIKKIDDFEVYVKEELKKFITLRLCDNEYFWGLLTYSVHKCFEDMLNNKDKVNILINKAESLYTEKAINYYGKEVEISIRRIIRKTLEKHKTEEIVKANASVISKMILEELDFEDKNRYEKCEDEPKKTD